jgi:integrase
MTSVGTGLRYLAVASRVFNVAVKQLVWLDKSPVDGVQRPRHEEIKAPRMLRPAEEMKLLKEADASDNRTLQVVVRIALRAGMRLNEIMRLRWHHIEFYEGHALILVKKAKNKRERHVPLVGDALEAVVRWRVPRGDAYCETLLFPSKKNAEKPVLIRSAWNTCLKRAGVKEFRFHDLRHTLASRLAAGNFSLPRIGNVLGHIDHRSTMIYTHFATDDAVQMVTHSAQASAAAIAKLNATSTP